VTRECGLSDTRQPPSTCSLSAAPQQNIPRNTLERNKDYVAMAERESKGTAAAEITRQQVLKDRMPKAARKAAMRLLTPQRAACGASCAPVMKVQGRCCNGC